MQLKYYSFYPYENPGYKLVHRKPKRNDCNLSKSAVDLAFQLYPAAICETVDHERSISEFIADCWEAMDMPQYRTDYNPGDVSYIDPVYHVKVIPTQHFYGATNSLDGVYVIDDVYYTIDSGEVVSYISLVEAINAIAWRWGADNYTKGINYQLENL